MSCDTDTSNPYGGDLMAVSRETVPYVNEPYFRKHPEEIEKDLAFLSELALNLGATRATLLAAQDIVIDVRVPNKCRIPPCHGYGSNLMCPPRSPKPQETEEIVNNYKQALFVRKELKSDEVLSQVKQESSPEDAAKKKNQFRLNEMDINTLVSRLEGEAFYLGYYLAFAFGAGPCFICGSKNLTPDGNLQVICEGLEAGRCIHPMKSRYSLEACGIDVYATSSKLGWPIYVIGERTDPEKVRCVGVHGLLMIY